ncbi:MAG: 5-(carboxyamino)imidazole ribonucleotide mutase [Chthoniobacterales bacterium]
MAIEKLIQELSTPTTEVIYKPIVSVVMGSKSDWPTMMEAAHILEKFGIAYEAKVLSAHRMPDAMACYAREAEKSGLRIIIAGAGGAAHLPGMLAAQTAVPVLGVPIKSKILNGIDSLLSIVQMPAGIPVATFAIGEAGAKNAALFAIAILAANDLRLAKQLAVYRSHQTSKAADCKLEMLHLKPNSKKN